MGKDSRVIRAWTEHKLQDRVDAFIVAKAECDDQTWEVMEFGKRSVLYGCKPYVAIIKRTM